jgi:hypothetical protein
MKGFWENSGRILPSNYLLPGDTVYHLVDLCFGRDVVEMEILEVSYDKEGMVSCKCQSKDKNTIDFFSRDGYHSLDLLTPSPEYAKRYLKGLV